MTSARFSNAADQAILSRVPLQQSDVTSYDYDFENFFHPLIGQLIQRLNQATGDPIAALLDPDFLGSLSAAVLQQRIHAGAYLGLSRVTSYPKAIDLDGSLPYANYNWELIYHIPVAVAVHLSQNGRFAEAQKWFHYVFDPTSTDTVGPGRRRGTGSACTSGTTRSPRTSPT